MIYSQPRICCIITGPSGRDLSYGAVLLCAYVYCMYACRYTVNLLSQKLFNDGSRQLHDYNMLGIGINIMLIIDRNKRDRS